MIIFDEVPMMGGRVLYFIDKCLCQASGKQDVRFGGLIMMFVGDFQKLPPVGDSPLYEECWYGNILFKFIEYAVQLIESHRHCQEQDDNDPLQRYFQCFFIRFQ